MNCLLAVRVWKIIQSAKIFWSRKDETIHSFWFYLCSFIDFETTRVSSWESFRNKYSILFMKEKFHVQYFTIYTQ